MSSYQPLFWLWKYIELCQKHMYVGCWYQKELLSHKHESFTQNPLGPCSCLLPSSCARAAQGWLCFSSFGQASWSTSPTARNKEKAIPCETIIGYPQIHNIPSLLVHLEEWHLDQCKRHFALVDFWRHSLKRNKDVHRTTAFQKFQPIMVVWYLPTKV